MKVQTGNKTKEQVVEVIREGIMWAAKVGDTLAVNMDSFNPDFKTEWNFPEEKFDTHLLFNSKEFRENENFKKMLKENEDVDNDGNKGYYFIKPDYQLALIYNYESDAHIGEVLANLPCPEGFEVFIIRNA